MIVVMTLLSGCTNSAGPAHVGPSPDDPRQSFVATSGIDSFPLKRKIDCPGKSILKSEQLKSSTSFSLRFAVGSVGDGFDLLEVNDQGLGTFRYRDWKIPQDLPHEWHQAKFQMSEDQINDVKDALLSSHVLSLSDTYIGAVEDGMQIGIQITAGKEEKIIYCYNHFPEPVIELYISLRRTVFKPHRDEIENAEKVDVGEGAYVVGMDICFED